MTDSQTKANKTFEVGKLYYDRCDFDLSVQNLKEAAALYLEIKEYSKFLKCQNMLLRIYAEKDMPSEIQTTKELLQDLVLREGFELNSKTYYTLALCAAYKGQYDTSLEYLQKALAIALAVDSKEDICYAINGISLCYNGMGKNNEALKEIYNLQVFFQVLDVPEVRLSSQILNARILSDMGKHEQAIDVLWQTYESLRKEKTINMHLHMLYNMGRAYLRMGDKDMARLYLRMAYKATDPENLKRLSQAIQGALNELGDTQSSQYDLVFELDSHTVIEKKIGKVDFKNQFILLDLLKLFAQNQGKVYSKEFLVENVWKQNYDPAIHDNKIYVTIKRLRKLIEPDYEKPKYIFRAKNGYFMSKGAKVFVEKRGGDA